MTRDLVTIDFETEPIERRPKFPPEPVGVALLRPGQRPVYRAWGHPEGNNCTREQARAELADILKSTDHDFLFFNASFDIAVAHERLSLPLPDARRIQDAQTLAFLCDPHGDTLKLKDLAPRYCGIQPAERDELRDWIMANVRKPDGKKLAPSKWGEHIARAPTHLVAPYACADVEMTRALFDTLHTRVIGEMDMVRPYTLEQRLLPCLMEMERTGVPIDAERLEADLPQWQNSVEVVDSWLRERLAAPQLDVNSSPQLASALDAAKLVSRWVYTEPTKKFPAGQRSTAMDNLLKVVTDRDVLAVLKYRAKLAWSIRTLALNWLEQASETGGLIHCAWNAHGRADGHKAPRTGRISSSPNLQNVPKTPELVAFSEAEAAELQAEADRLDTKVMRLPAELRGKAQPLPVMRSYIVGRMRDGARDWLVNHDYSQQELRILAHYEDGALLDAYRANPRMDVHDWTKALIHQKTGKDLPRRKVKNVGFSLVNGAGIKGYLHYIGADEEDPAQLAESQEIRDAYFEAMPGIKALDKLLKTEGRNKRPIRTYGERQYLPERPSIDKTGRLRTWEYKLMSMLIQGSAGDCTKEGMVNYYEHPDRAGYLLLTVHDELLGGCAPDEEIMRRESHLLATCMEDVKFDLPILVDPKVSRRSWADGVSL